jgi:tripartite-type tricarboxylate transporter receptor subunit TctC
MRTSSIRPLILAGLLLGLQTAPAHTYPTKTIRLIVPVAPGGSLDFITRVIGAKMADRMGQAVVVENRPGAGTTIAATAAARSAPDGHTLLVGSSAALAINPTLFKRLPYDAVKDFEPVALILRIPLVLVVNPSLPVHSVSDLIKLAKQRPGQLFYASAGPGTQLHLAMERLKAEAGIDLVHVPYKGAVPGLLDVLTGSVQLIFAEPRSALPLIRSGKVRALGVSSATRMTTAPDIPPIAEEGFPGFEAIVWIMIVTPAKTPPAIVHKLSDELKRIVALPDVRRAIAELGVVPIDSPAPAELRKFIKAEMAHWSTVLKRVGLAGSQ